MMFSFRTFCDFFHLLIQRLKENDYENTLFVQLETRMIALHCSMYKINNLITHFEEKLYNYL